MRIVDSDDADLDLDRGRSAFASALCYRCHRVGDVGGTTGPDLTGVGQRYGIREIVESIVQPDRVISDQYRMARIVLDDGKIVSGKVADVSGNRILVVTDAMTFAMSTIDRGRVEQIIPSEVSMMPSGLLNRFTADEIRELIAYLRRQGIQAAGTN
jgi:putative heme-binding domain-containing protein